MPELPLGLLGPATVVGVGAVSVDQTLYVDQPYSAGKGRIVRHETSYGGNIATALVAIASLGGQARFVGYLPDSLRWLDVHQNLLDLGVDITDATTAQGENPIQSTILIAPDGERFIAFDDKTLVGSPPDLDIDVVVTAGALLLDGYSPVAGRRLARACRAAGVPVIADLERADLPGIEALQLEVSHLVVPRTYAETVVDLQSPIDIVEALWAPGREAVVVTDGANGSWFKAATDKNVQHYPAFAVEVVDTTGCGDVFHGVFAHAIANGLPVDSAVERASAAGAICATGVGGRGHLPSENDLGVLLAMRAISTPGRITTKYAPKSH